MMNHFIQDPWFWLATAGATVIKLLTSPFHSYTRFFLTGFAAVFAACVFTAPALAWLEIDSEVYKYAMTAIITLTGEGLMRLAIRIVNDPAQAISIIKAWRGVK